MSVHCWARAMPTQRSRTGWKGVKPHGPRSLCGSCGYWLWPSEAQQHRFCCPQCGDSMGAPAQHKGRNGDKSGKGKGGAKQRKAAQYVKCPCGNWKWSSRLSQFCDQCGQAWKKETAAIGDATGTSQARSEAKRRKKAEKAETPAAAAATPAKPEDAQLVAPMHQG